MKTKLIIILITYLVLNAQIHYKPQAETKENKLVELVFVKGGAYQLVIKISSKINDEYNYDINDIYVGKYEITQAQYITITGKNPSHFKGDSLPVENVSWNDAIEFCNKLSDKEGFDRCYKMIGDSMICDFSVKGYRLPTEAERHFITKGGSKSNNYKYSGSNNIEEVAEYNVNNGKSTKIVGKKLPNELGIYDMSGNVAEWCWDLYFDTPVSKYNNPKAISKKNGRRVMCGGGYSSDQTYCQVDYSVGIRPEIKTDYWGFRVVRNAE